MPSNSGTCTVRALIQKPLRSGLRSLGFFGFSGFLVVFPAPGLVSYPPGPILESVFLSRCPCMLVRLFGRLTARLGVQILPPRGGTISTLSYAVDRPSNLTNIGLCINLRSPAMPMPDQKLAGIPGSFFRCFFSSRTAPSGRRAASRPQGPSCSRRK